MSGPGTRATSSPCSARRASLGPVVGGFFAGQATILGIAGWRWVFLVNVPIGIVALLIVVRGACTCRTPRRDHRID